MRNNTQRIYERLSRGEFLSVDSADASVRHLYEDIEENLENFYTSFVIYSKSALYKIHIAFKEQIRNKTVFFYNSVFFSFHLISFFALGNI